MSFVSVGNEKVSVYSSRERIEFDDTVVEITTTNVLVQQSMVPETT